MNTELFPDEVLLPIRVKHVLNSDFLGGFDGCPVERAAAEFFQTGVQKVYESVTDVSIDVGKNQLYTSFVDYDHEHFGYELFSELKAKADLSSQEEDVLYTLKLQKK